MVSLKRVVYVQLIPYDKERVRLGCRVMATGVSYNQLIMVNKTTPGDIGGKTACRVVVLGWVRERLCLLYILCLSC